MAETEGDDVRVLAILGSLRRKSYNRSALLAAAELCPPGMTLDLGGLADDPPRNPIGDLPLYNDDVREEEGFPEAALALADRIRAADAVLFVTPEYNFSIPGALKNAIDWLSRMPEQPFNDKPFAVMGAARGPVGTARVQYHMRQAGVFLNMHALNKPEVFISLAAGKFDDDGRLTDEETGKFIRAQLEALRDWALRFR